MTQPPPVLSNDERDSPLMSARGIVNGLVLGAACWALLILMWLVL